MRRFRSLWSDQRGNTAILFGLAIIPIIAFSGGAVDFSHRADVRSKLQSAADVAALAAARTMQSGELSRDPDRADLKAAAKKNAQRIFNASLAGLAGAKKAKPKIQITNNLVRVSANVDVDTSFLTILGMRHLAASGYAEVKLPPPTLVEIALVLDYSKSMVNNDKYIRMTHAAVDFINKIAQDRGSSTKIGIVPFSEYVLASMEGANIRDTPAADRNTVSAACLLNRDYPYSTSGDTPKSGIAASRWPQVDPAGSKCQAYKSQSLAVHDLTNDFSSLTGALSAMTPIGLTNIALGAEMGWQLLSPNPPFETAANYSDKNVRKILILLTDGVQTVSAMGPSGEVSVAAANDTTAELCSNIKDAGITVFSIAYDVDDTAVYTLLSNCASGASKYHEVDDASGIGPVFDDIYSQIAESVWLSK